MHDLGHTRSANRRDHLLQTPDTFVRTPLPGLTGGAAIVHTAPEMGAAFAMMTVEFESGGSLTHACGQRPCQRFVYVLEGELRLEQPGLRQDVLQQGGFAYLPAQQPHRLEAKGKVRAIVLDKTHSLLDPTATRPAEPQFVRGAEEIILPAPLNGDSGVQVRGLLPPEMCFDFAVNTMTYAPGASLAQVEVHYMEHGLLMLEGAGIYRLGDAWYPVQAGDFIWMAPFCPQWFGCIGKTPAKYLIYKNFNRHVLA